MKRLFDWASSWIETWRIAPPFSQRRRDIIEATNDLNNPDAWVAVYRPYYQDIDRGIADMRGYCYACPTPIEVGDEWKRQRVGNSVPHSFRIVHADCPISYEEIAELATINEYYRKGLMDAARVARAQGTATNKPPCPAEMVGVYLDRLANGELP